MSDLLTGCRHADLDTPALLVDLDLLEGNITHIAEACRAGGVNWRPHIKASKTPEIARMQIAAGAIGVTCAKLSEAEVMAEAGIGDILIANQVVGTVKIARLAALRHRADVVVAVDSEENVTALGEAMAAEGLALRVVIELDIGMRRAGVSPGPAVRTLARRIAAQTGLRLVGLMGWESQVVLIADPAEKRRAVQDAISLLTGSAEACRQDGHAISIVSCGGTGSFPYCLWQPGVTEVQVGGGIFNDIHCRDHYHFERPQALAVLTTVTSRPTPTRIVLDAGKKAMSGDAALPRPRDLPPVRSVRLSAEHTTIELEAPALLPKVGDQLELVVGYSDTTVHLHEWILGTRGGRVASAWQVAARGRLS